MKNWNKQRVWNEIENNLERKTVILPTWVYYMAASIIVILLFNLFYINKLNNLKNNYISENKTDTVFINDTIFEKKIVENIVYKTNEKIVYKQKTVYDTVFENKYIVKIDTFFIENKNNITDEKIVDNKDKIVFSKYNFSNMKINSNEKINIKINIIPKQINNNQEYFVKNKSNFFKYELNK